MVNFTLFWSQFFYQIGTARCGNAQYILFISIRKLIKLSDCGTNSQQISQTFFYQHIMTGCDLSASLCDKPYSLTQHGKVILYLILPRLRTRHGAARARSDCPTLRHNCCAQAIILPVRLPST